MLLARMIAPPQALAALAVVSAVASAPAAAAYTPPPTAPRLTGNFQLAGRVTVAKRIRGEHPGDQVSRIWSFTPACGNAPCGVIQLVRQRAHGTDTVTLTATSPTTYSGVGDFYVPLRCGHRTYAKGELVPFTVTITITAAAVVFDVPVATGIHATYTNRKRQNLTRCVAIPGRDAAVYDGTIIPAGQ